MDKTNRPTHTTRPRAERRHVPIAPAARDARSAPLTAWSLSLGASEAQLGSFDAALTSVRAALGPAGGDAPLQLERDGAGAMPDAPHTLARQGTRDGARSLPHQARIQAAFGRHDVSGVRAYVGGAAARANEQLGARGFALGDAVAFRDAPDVRLAAHEAAHVVQQRAGISLAGSVGQVGDAYEQHADAVADAVAAGRSAEALLDRYAGGRGTPASTAALVQRQVAEGTRQPEAARASETAGPAEATRTPQAAAQPEATRQAVIPTTARRAEAEALRRQAIAIRDQLDAQARGGGTPDAALLAQLRALRAQQLPIWVEIVQTLTPLVEAERAQAAASTTPAPEARPTRPTRGRARLRRAPARAATPLEEALAEATERRDRLQNAARRDRLREIAAALESGGGDRGALEGERDRLVGGMGHFRRLSQGDRRWGRQAYLGNDGRELYNQNRGGAVHVATVQEGGCGVTSLLMVQAFYERENPEAELRSEADQMQAALAEIRAMHARGSGRMLDDGTTRGREAHGTDWGAIARGIGGQVANLRGQSVGPSGIEAILRSGRQVVWQKVRPAHFVVISRIVADRGDGRIFHVSDPGFPDANVSLEEIRGNRVGTWVLSSQY